MPQYRQICSQTCAKKIVYGLALFLAIMPAIVCFLHEWNRERLTPNGMPLLVEQMQQSVQTPPAWQTAVPKVLELNQNRSLFPSVAGIAFYDASSRLMYQETISRPFLPLTFATDIGLRTDGGVLGTLRIDSRVDYIVLWTLLIGLFSGGGGAMGFYFYRYSLRNIHQMQLAKQRAFEHFSL